MTDWLSDDEQRAWRRVVSGSRRLLAQLDGELKCHGLNHDDYGVLVALADAPDDRLRMGDLADAVAESRSRLSHHIARMERQGLVARQSCPEDRRGSWAVLTPAGRGLLESTAPSHVAGVRRWLVDLLEPDELALLGDVFARVDDHLREAGSP